jgi:glutamate N-acetyltransferase/amino-acid N-acetyltransferase
MSVTAPKGFEANGVACGIKASGAPDLALVATADRRAVPAAGAFTTNRVQAAPVQVTREHLGDGHAAAVILNSGNANAATGEPGREVARRMCALAGAGLGAAATDVLVCSTGLIGIPLPVEPIEAGIGPLVGGLATTPEAGAACGDAIMTTDTVRKEAAARVTAAGLDATVGGVAKGAAMLSPAMATMLAVVTTDVAASPTVLRRAVTEGVHTSFNRLIVDGSRSTNDTVLLLANGAAGGPHIEYADGPAYLAFLEAVTAVCRSLAQQMARDAEGATKYLHVVVRGARTHGDAVRAARAVAGSRLVQCSLYGQDPYWGRVLSELGASGALLDPERVDIAYNGITVCRDGVASDHDADALAAAMAGRDIEIRCHLHVGPGEAEIFGADLTHAYVDENMGRS